MPDFLGRGPRFPLFEDRADARTGPLLLWSDGDAKIRQSIELILSTAPGERVMRPDFGCGIHELVFEPITPGLTALLVDRVTSALVRWEPRIDVLQVEARQDVPSEPVLQLDITYRVRANNAVHNMVYPFYLQEGAA
jgi:uncharacterized protein